MYFQFLKSEPNKISVKYNNHDEFKSFTMTRQTKRPVMIDYELKLAYDPPLKIDSVKIKDLKYVCLSGLIPEQYHQFYFALFENGTSKCR